jgi:hypothetical protein
VACHESEARRRAHQRREEADNEVEDVNAERVGDDVPALGKVSAGHA